MLRKLVLLCLLGVGAIAVSSASSVSAGVAREDVMGSTGATTPTQLAVNSGTSNPDRALNVTREAEHKVESKAETKTGSKLEQTKTEPETESKAETKTEPETESKAETKTESKAETKAETKTDSRFKQTKTEPETESKTKAESKAEFKAESKAETKVKTKAEMNLETNAEPVAEPKAEMGAVGDVRSAGRAGDLSPQTTRYDGHVLLGVTPRTSEQIAVLRSLFRSDQVDVWRGPSSIGEDVQFAVRPGDFNWTVSYLDGNGLEHSTIIADVQRVIDSQASTRRVQAAFGWEDYHHLGSIYQWMEHQVQRHASVASLVVGGMSSEGRQILGVRIAHAKDLPIFYLEGGIHGREWISPAATTFILDRLLNSNDPRVVRAATSFEWHVFPSVNPDSYEYSHTSDRLWRKSRRRTSIRCYGADLNRNFPHQWGTTGVSWNFCSEVYPGTRAASEIETRTRLQYMEELLPRTKAFLALHSYGQYFLLPWGFTFDKTPDHERLLKIASKSAESFTSRHGTPLRVGNLAATLYPASGSSLDWAYSKGVPFSYTIELRDRGQFGHLLPASQITSASEETLDAIVAMANAILDELQHS